MGRGDEALLHLMREGFDTPTVAAYDSFRIAGPLTATAGLNVHPKARIGSFLLPSYGLFFRTLVTHVVVEGRGWAEMSAEPSGSPGTFRAPSSNAPPDSRLDPSSDLPGGASLEVTPDPLEARARLMSGARTGNAFVSVGRMEAARDFRMGVVRGDRLVAGMGASAVLAEGTLLRAGFDRAGGGRTGAGRPGDTGTGGAGARGDRTRGDRAGPGQTGTGTEPGRKLLYRILRNGEELAWISGGELEWRPEEPGIYRVEVHTYGARVGNLFLRLKPWIFANPVDLRSPPDSLPLP
jgi:hypothetical protein